ncbi:DUF4112 domain-containing protein [Halosimplex salinum]|uniref:DUF4112 domain-containing protein n=1 Tax=Halosimplex salinum TaxID=1710538 RepID=UPI000F467D44|nr:DUF4112 domain-containing protein [Halosimplex salinum]
MASVTTGEAEPTGESDDRAALERAQSVAHLLDEAVRIPGTPVRIGADPILGIAPVSGDLVAALASLYIVFKAVEVGVPTRSVVAMLGRITVEFVVGSVPVLGTILDAGWKVNKRNVDVMEAHVEGTA